MTFFELERTQLIPRPLAEVFDFFSRAHNLERLTPPFLGFEILTPEPIEMKVGTLIEYRLKLYGLPVRWRTRIDRFEPGRAFVDRQLRGPYRHWEHLHEFRAVPGGTEMRDLVRYALPLGPLGRVARALFVRRTLEGIFDFRRQAVANLFPATPDPEANP